MGAEGEGGLGAEPFRRLPLGVPVLRDPLLVHEAGRFLGDHKPQFVRSLHTGKYNGKFAPGKGLEKWGEKQSRRGILEPWNAR